MAEPQRTKKFGIDAATHELVIGSWRMRLPQSRALRIAIGAVLILGGFLGFLPVLGFWMVPLGLIVLSHDLAFVRRRRRKLSVWWARKRQTSN
jgi:purine-cytosine permease-like protein